MPKDKTLNLRYELKLLIERLTPRTCYSCMFKRGISDKYFEKCVEKNIYLYKFKSFEDENKKLVYFKNFLQELIFDIKKLEIEDLYCVEESCNVNEYEKLIVKKIKELKNMLGYK